MSTPNQERGGVECRDLRAIARAVTEYNHAHRFDERIESRVRRERRLWVWLFVIALWFSGWVLVGLSTGIRLNGSNSTDREELYVRRDEEGANG